MPRSVEQMIVMLKVKRDALADLGDAVQSCFGRRTVPLGETLITFLTCDIDAQIEQLEEMQQPPSRARVLAGEYAFPTAIAKPTTEDLIAATERVQSAESLIEAFEEALEHSLEQIPEGFLKLFTLGVKQFARPVLDSELRAAKFQLSTIQAGLEETPDPQNRGGEPAG